MTAEQIMERYQKIEKIHCVAQENLEDRKLQVICEFLFELVNDLLENTFPTNPVTEESNDPII